MWSKAILKLGERYSSVLHEEMQPNFRSLALKTIVSLQVPPNWCLQDSSIQQHLYSVMRALCIQFIHGKGAGAERLGVEENLMEAMRQVIKFICGILK